jgi:hypothetical protein
VIRLIIKVEHFGPDGTTLAPTFKTLDIDSPELAAALTPPRGAYLACTLIGAEELPEGKPDVQK